MKYRAETMEGVTIIGTTEKQAMIASAQPEIGRFLTDSTCPARATCA